MKTKSVSLNILTNIISKLLTVFFAVLIPKLYIDYFGSEVNGLIFSVAGIFVYINLLEAGIGAASIQALYKPISERNQKKINGILSATDTYYKKAGIYFLACLSIVIFLYPLLIETPISFFTIVMVILLSGISSFLSFFIQGKYNVLLHADNKFYILTTISTVSNLLSNIIRIVLIIQGYDVITVQATFALVSILQLLAVHRYVKKRYPEVSFKAVPDNLAISQKSSVMVHQIAGVIFANTDVLIISAFLGLKEASVYMIYNMIFMQAGFLPNILATSLTAGLGQLYTENQKKFKSIYNFFEVYYIAIACSVLTTAYLLILPFLEIYTANVEDIEYLDAYLAVLFFVVNILSAVRWPSVLLVTITGHFSQTKVSAIIEMVLNIVLSLSLVFYWGVYGVLFASLVALLFRTADIILYTNRQILVQSSWITFRRLLYNVFFTLVIIYIFAGIELSFDSYLEFVLIGGVLLFVLTVLYCVVNSIFEKDARVVLNSYMLMIWRKIFSMV